MQIDDVNLSSHVLIRLNGRFDFSARDTFMARIRQIISAAEPAEVRIDMAGVSYIDSSALGMLLMARDIARQRDRELSLGAMQPMVRQALDTAQFGRLFKFH